ncbi:hypothetical protein V8E55_009131, partial [Tylopilus felleus]
TRALLTCHLSPVRSGVKIRFRFSRAVCPRTSGAFDREGVFVNPIILSMDDNDDLWRSLESLEDGECEPDCSCAGCLLASTTQDYPPPPPEEPDEPPPPIQLDQTRHKKAALQGQDILSNIRKNGEVYPRLPRTMSHI